MDDLTVITCSYNTPDVTLTMLRSFCAHHSYINPLIIDNSTDDETEMLLSSSSIPYIRNKGGLHNRSVDILFKNVVTQYALLVDTDVIFLKNQQPIFTKFKQSSVAILGDICGDRGGKKIHNRVHPWYCWLDMEQIKKHHISFFNESKQFSKSNKIYDVGCTFFEDVKEAGLHIGDIKLENNYFKHYEGMSWRTKRYGKEDGDIDHNAGAVHNNLSLYQLGRYNEELYRTEIQRYKNIEIKCK